MLKLNREKAAAALSLVIFGIGLYSLVTSEVREYKPVDISLTAANVQVPVVEPKLSLERTGGDRNPFRLSSEWERVKPDSLPLPPDLGSHDVRVSFGWLAERAAGAPIRLRKAALKEIANEADAGAGSGAGGSR